MFPWEKAVPAVVGVWVGVPFAPGVHLLPWSETRIPACSQPDSQTGRAAAIPELRSARRPQRPGETWGPGQTQLELRLWLWLRQGLE